MTVGFYSPLPPARTGVADYAAALLGELRRHGRVEIAPRRCDVALYHLGNNPLHAETYRRALERPGVVVLHDAVLHHFLLGRLGQSEYLEEFAYNYGEARRATAAQLWRERAGAAADARYFEFPMLRRALERALAVVAHNPQAAGMARDHAPDARVVEIPHLLQGPAPPPSEAAVARYRRSLGFPPDAFLFGIFGYLRESKRLLPALDVLAGLRREDPRVAALVAGDFASAALERTAEPYFREPGALRRPYLRERDFWLAAAAVDAGVNLRDPSAGETSGIAIRLMAMGKPVLMTDSPACARFPADACIRIARGVAERESLRQNVRLLMSAPEAAAAIGRRAAEYVRAGHCLERVGARYWELLYEYGI